MSAVLHEPALSLRPMRHADIDAVMAIERQAYDFPWTPTIFRDCLRVGYCCWVGERGGRMEAYGVMSVAAGEAHLLNLCVRPEVQGAGLGRALLEHLIGVAISHHAEVLLLEVRPSNVRALQLYRQLGFQVTGRRKDYYPAEKGREDALVLSLALEPVPSA